MMSGLGGWSVFLVLGALLWVSGVGALTHPGYRLLLTLAILSWCAYIARTPKSS